MTSYLPSATKFLSSRVVSSLTSDSSVVFDIFHPEIIYIYWTSSRSLFTCARSKQVDISTWQESILPPPKEKNINIREEEQIDPLVLRWPSFPTLRKMYRLLNSWYDDDEIFNELAVLTSPPPVCVCVYLRGSRATLGRRRRRSISVSLLKRFIFQCWLACWPSATADDAPSCFHALVFVAINYTAPGRQRPDQHVYLADEGTLSRYIFWRTASLRAKLKVPKLYSPFLAAGLLVSNQAQIQTLVGHRYDGREKKKMLNWE